MAWGSQGARPQPDPYTSLTLARTQQVTVVMPVLTLLCAVLVVLALNKVMPAYYAVALVLGVCSLASIVFSRAVFAVVDRLQGRLQRQNQQLRALYDSSLQASAHLSLRAILQTVADSARELAHARYTAIFVGEGENMDQIIASGATEEETQILQILLPAWTEQLLQDNQTYRTSDLGADPRVKLPRSFPTVKSFMAVPLLSQGNAVGYFVATDKEGGPFNDEDQAMLETFAVQAAVDIENVRLQRAAQDAAALKERERIALDLHDGVIQQLYGIGLRLDSGLDSLESQPEAVRADIDGAIEGLNAVIRDVRSHIFHLQPNQLEGRGLTEALSELLEELSVNALIRTDLVVDRDHDPGECLSPDQTERIIAVAREALDNVRRHSQAYHVRAEVERKGGLLNLRIVDDGIGMTPEKLASEEAGLGGMKENARLLRAKLSVTTEAQGGTAVSLTVPLEG